MTLVVLRGAARAALPRCGQPFCPYCKSGRTDHEYCSQCVHLFVLGDGLAPETKSMKLYEVERHETRAGAAPARRPVAPGASHVLSGRCVGRLALLMLLADLACIAGSRRILAPVERVLGIGVPLAGFAPARPRGLRAGRGLPAGGSAGCRRVAGRKPWRPPPTGA
jgi:hypothetical protein